MTTILATVFMREREHFMTCALPGFSSSPSGLGTESSTVRGTEQPKKERTKERGSMETSSWSFSWRLETDMGRWTWSLTRHGLHGPMQHGRWGPVQGVIWRGVLTVFCLHSFSSTLTEDQSANGKKATRCDFLVSSDVSDGGGLGLLFWW